MKTKTLTAILIVATLQLNATENPGQLAKTNTSISTIKNAKLKPASPPMFSAGFDIGFYRSTNKFHSSVPNAPENTGKSSFFSISPQLWYNPNAKYSIIPSFGFGFYSYTYESEEYTTEEKENYMYPSLAFLRYCSDPCDKFQTFTGLRVGGGFGNGTYHNATKGPDPMIYDSKTEYSESYVSALAGISYNFTPNFSVFGSADIIGYSKSKSITDDKTPDNYNSNASFNFGQHMRVGALYNFNKDKK